ncbi:MAG: vWA domain-containing protein [Planctomycetota bacterium]
MKITHIALLALAVMLFAGAPAAADEDRLDPGPCCPPEKVAPTPPKVEIVFVLDTTGSMGGLIEGAKVKIWTIVNQVVTGKPTPDLKVGLVGYRDRGDSYVTTMTDLTSDLDSVYGALRGFSAAGGGDTPESVNEALHVALTKPKWSTEKRTLRIIYLVGDAPPHMDYQDDVKYPVTCEAAARKGIIINTIQCGNLAGTDRVWKDIARRAEGRYVRIRQSGGMTAVKTPYDERLAALSRKLSGTSVFYGDEESRRREGKKLAEADKAADSAAPEAAAERAGYRGKSGLVAVADLLGLLERGEVKIADLDAKKLPEDLAKMSPEERKAHLGKLLAERKKLRAELVELDAKRAAHIKAELAKKGKKGDAFDDQVLDMLRDQAKKVGLKYE